MPAAVVIASLAALLGGCSVGPTVSVSPESLAQQVSDQLEEQVGVAPDDVECPETLEGETGASTRCELMAGGATYGVTVTVTSVEGTTVRLDIQVDDEPTEADA
ncbi:DUF4333 domain-containing protein [Actinotalea ferrariae]|nr:DUF4333 domain-containing protein [Actinotalea ferrariae]